MDGNAELHNLNRIDKNNKSTFNRILKSINLLKKYKVEFNILTVITGKNARSIDKIYNFFKKNDFKYLQFIPCLEPIHSIRGVSNYHLSVKDYSKFLIRLFELWYDNFLKGDAISIRNIDNIIHMALGNPPELCSMAGVCSVQFVVEGDGSVYPCDFYVLDKYKIGTIGKDSLESMVNSDIANKF